MLRLNLDGFSEEEVLGYILRGLEADRDTVEASIKALKSQLQPAKTRSEPPTRAAAPKGRSRMSAEGRARIAAAQKKRWAAAKRTAKKAAKPARKTRGARVDLVPAEAEPEQAAE